MGFPNPRWERFAYRCSHRGGNGPHQSGWFFNEFLDDFDAFQGPNPKIYDILDYRSAWVIVLNEFLYSKYDEMTNAQIQREKCLVLRSVVEGVLRFLSLAMFPVLKKKSKM